MFHTTNSFSSCSSKVLRTNSSRFASSSGDFTLGLEAITTMLLRIWTPKTVNSVSNVSRSRMVSLAMLSKTKNFRHLVFASATATATRCAASWDVNRSLVSKQPGVSRSGPRIESNNSAIQSQIRHCHPLQQDTSRASICGVGKPWWIWSIDLARRESKREPRSLRKKESGCRFQLVEAGSDPHAGPPGWDEPVLAQRWMIYPKLRNLFGGSNKEANIENQPKSWNHGRSWMAWMISSLAFNQKSSNGSLYSTSVAFVTTLVAFSYLVTFRFPYWRIRPSEKCFDCSNDSHRHLSNWMPAWNLSTLQNLQHWYL